MGVPSIFVWTHDSVALGEDGPTHQPIEQIASLRAIPNLDMVRPADANETSYAWKTILEKQKPAGIFLSRQNVRTIDRATHSSATGVAAGAYILKEASSAPDVILIATGSELALALDSQIALESKGVSTRVVSAPCLEWFNEEPLAYRQSVLSPTAKLRVSIEAGVSQGWREYVGDNGIIIAIDHFGASAGAAKLFTEFGFTVDRIVGDVLGAL
jgi:transketolase